MQENINEVIKTIKELQKDGCSPELAIQIIQAAATMELKDTLSRVFREGITNYPC